jgi:RNA polymerase sigma factor (sigma-70 family)
MAVWQHYYPMVRALAVRMRTGMTGQASPADVEDAVSSTFLSAFEQGSRLSYDGVTPYGAFLLGIGRNVMRRQVRKDCREPVFEPTVADLDPDPSSSPEETFLGREQTAVLARFADGLAPEERDVFFGYYRDGLSEETLSAALCRTRYRVRKTLARVEKRLRRFLAERGFGR